MIPIQDARRIVLQQARPLPGTERVAVSRAVGRVLARPVEADTDLPPYDRVTMDGFAVRAADVARAGTVLPVAGEVAAGAGEAPAVAPGTAVAITTGAALPPGADAVVPVEQTSPTPGGVRFERAVVAGANVAPRGEDLSVGQVVARDGERATVLGLSLLIAAGVGELAVRRRPRVALLTSGDELLPPGAPLGPGQIRESNLASLAALLEPVGADVAVLGVAPDDRRALAALYERAESADVIVMIGGASVGAHDHSVDVVEASGARRHFDRIAVKPGKPTSFFTRETADGAQLVFCLPGNPVAALMTGRVLVAPALARLQGEAVADWSPTALPLAAAVPRDARRDQLLPMRVESRAGRPVLVFDGWHGSGDLVSVARAHGFAFVARGEGSAPAGTPAEVFLMPGATDW